LIGTGEIYPVKNFLDIDHNMDYILVKKDCMKYSEIIRPISFLKAHASELIRELSKSKKTLIITQNGEAKAVVQDIKLYEQNMESMALLKILAQSNNSVRNGKIKPISKAFSDLESRIRENTSK